MRRESHQFGRATAALLGAYSQITEAFVTAVASPLGEEARVQRRERANANVVAALDRLTTRQRQDLLVRDTVRRENSRGLRMIRQAIVAPVFFAMTSAPNM